MKYWFILLLLITTCARADLQTAIAVYQQGDSQKAEKMFLALQTEPDARIYLARIWQNQDLDKAEDWIEQALEQAPENPLAHFVKGSIMASQASNSSIFSAYGYAKDSLRGFKKAVELAPDNVQFRQGLLLFYLQAPGIAGGDEEAALAQVEAIEKENTLAGIKARLIYFKETGHKQKYEELMFRARQHYRNKSDFHYLEAINLQEKKQFLEAQKLFEKASVLPDADEQSNTISFSALYQIGRTAVLAQSFIGKGIQALQHYIQKAPDSRQLPEKYWARFRLANLLELKGEKQQAMEIYQSLLTVEDNQLLERVKKQLQRS
ncbi:tetratricopeptide repeat protein [Lacimicrobium alkaliphilum]|uniref:Tetratricopeptide repeat protein n=1 Tax=Lacimicrobium alkaliphilum TaxID=1526571 RepID=A0ABQ1QZ17_9ALTE|nr:tetratricopeptide repeat protein [Lacimicrobium alkaliphilum]GGD49422.1 hypothetical protein GCM10011357_01730 [Lacimicrobium alkaliphilum]